ncbi:MAG TPA: prolyl oligopeptidase family serine peptidase, partial [Thermoanaerobaculia bacterium]|nr:prolyl oligopeptidase family serine peptidase [Thermoanaerobaculia bacterium]
TTNEDGASVLKIADLPSAKVVASPQLPLGVIGGVEWHPNGRLIGFTLSHAKSPSDAYSYDVNTGAIERWTESETGGLNPERNVEPQLITTKSFDGTQISAFVYRPDATRFAGKRPVIINIHGGPEGQSRPIFLGRNNYWINELGIAMVYPNVRGSEGYGKTYLAMDNAAKREDSVRDIGAILDWIARDPQLDASRVAVAGGSYGGYMVLASMIHFADRLKAGVDVVGISSFLTFLQNTSGYRRDLRRVEYGDERDPQMRAHLEKISPLSQASKIRDPLFVIMGFNDPRVPYTEGEQIVKIVRESGAPVWYLMAKDEGHGFAKRANQDFQFIATTLFWQQHLLN